ncbi:hypothetical protein AQUCO_00500613v1 [Aquilegia coerulea]|uniref:Uncharacterized protein n=1 Tax=Aquilegia coerulea TaxID=218851 RepID=A0A2G5EST3_AQUCA|nr:hypothetical protein AQUCO_00500613v1 [Aquilegia coerulea]
MGDGFGSSSVSKLINLGSVDCQFHLEHEKLVMLKTQPCPFLINLNLQSKYFQQLVLKKNHTFYSILGIKMKEYEFQLIAISKIV